MTSLQTISPEKQKAIRLVEYLTRLTLLRSKSIRHYNDYEKVLWLSSIPHEDGCFTQAWKHDEEHESDEWLEVQTRREPPLPPVPFICQEWVDRETIRNKNDLPELLPKITKQVKNPAWREGSDHPTMITVSKQLDDHPTIQQAWEKYVEHTWLPWTEEHNVWESIHKVYKELFAIHQAQLRLGEEYELVLGLGLLIWQTPKEQRVQRHLIVADVMLEFEARLGKFTVRPHTEGAKLRPELDMLDVEDQPAHAEEVAKNSLTNAEDDPWDSDVHEVLKALVHSLTAQGDYDGSLERKMHRDSTKPTVIYAPALILRKRSTKGLTESMKRIKEQIENGADIPAKFADLAEIRSSDSYDVGNGVGKTNLSFEGQELFFPKPSNEEQRRIVQKIGIADGVLVQGPPGTGKSHTIANLVSHLLATGQRTLITAKTPRALQVLEGLLPEELRPLCINLLGSGLEERRSLESSVGGILRKNEEWRQDEATDEITELERELQRLREDKARIDRRLYAIRESETHSHSIAEGAYRGTAARIAEAINRVKGRYEWFTDTISLDMPCPLSPTDLLDILKALRQLTPEKRHELTLALPENLLTVDDFAQLLQRETIALEEEKNLASGVDEPLVNLLINSSSSAISDILETLTKFSNTRSRLTATHYSWMKLAVFDILEGNAAIWQELYHQTSQTILSVVNLIATADNTTLDLPETADLKMLYEDAKVLQEHMVNGGTLGWGIFRPKPVKERLYMVKSVRVNGRPCTDANHFSTLADVLRVRLAYEKVWHFWTGRTEPTHGPYILQQKALETLCKELENALSLEALVTKCREAISQCPAIREPVWNDTYQIERMIASCRLAQARIRKQEVIEQIKAIEALVFQMTAKGNAHPVVTELLNAIRERNVEGFVHCTNSIRELQTQSQYLQRLNKQVSELRQLLPYVTYDLEQTRHEPHWEERIQQIVDAWHWVQASYWLKEYLRDEDVPALSNRAKQIDSEIHRIIARLSALRAWSFCFSRLKNDHRRHMEAWQQSMRRLGKGTGKHAPRHRREAQQHLNECREAVPAWIMPLHRIWDTVNPTPGMFDVIIVDEASQCGFEALPLFYLEAI